METLLRPPVAAFGVFEVDTLRAEAPVEEEETAHGSRHVRFGTATQLGFALPGDVYDRSCGHIHRPNLNDLGSHPSATEDVLTWLTSCVSGKGELDEGTREVFLREVLGLYFLDADFEAYEVSLTECVCAFAQCEPRLREATLTKLRTLRDYAVFFSEASKDKENNTRKWVMQLVRQIRKLESLAASGTDAGNEGGINGQTTASPAASVELWTGSGSELESASESEVSGSPNQTDDTMDEIGIFQLEL